MDETKGGDAPPTDKTVYPDDPYGGATTAEVSSPPSTAVVLAGGGTRTPPPPPPDDDEEEEDDNEGGMLRMSFLEHLEELRSRLIKALIGFGVAFVGCLIFAYPLWDIVRAPAFDALRKIGIPNGHLTIIEPMENFSIIFVKLPLIASLFVASPWVIYQIWAFIAPGLYKKERRWAVPFVLTTAGLFILGGLFAYYVVFRFGLAFLLGIGLSGGVEPMVTITNYFDLFVDVVLGVALVFELPIALFFLTLLRLASPRWLMANSRYAILAITVLAAVVTPTPDIFNMMLFAVPMCALFFVGVFASFLLVWNREGRRIPWGKIWLGIIAAVALLGGIAFFLIQHYHLHFIRHAPFLMK